ncbi:secretion protein HlyD family protein [Syntrophobotulus glycolicus DSM 8271]|uniref:Secretion protein HlyD family protein n=1 Tax=Syntrophobotulus glycolicus (strain DSM 8271 / FlGlyR) TaxID=645991 RepID=F0SV67_SYNGF|nr:HlyD family efflux transporter periplasmic adaptor subunit [Syntrophobotulus glycolicus]ADY55567.1 secretion protein HlyD family protein [Syntrophobotulus glycolicus DSM 8271]
MKKIYICLGIILMILTLTGCSSSQLVLEGITETTIYSHYSEVEGKITGLPVELGQEIKAGDPIAIIDDSKERYALEQLQEALAGKQAALALLQQGAEPEELKQVQNSVELAGLADEKAQETKDRAQEAYHNAQALWEKGAIAQAELDTAKYQADLAENALKTASLQLDNAKQALALIQQGTPQEKIDAAQAEVAATEIQIRQIQENLAKYKITALYDGTVISRNYLMGDIISPGFSIADVAAKEERHLVAYVPREYLSSLSHGQEVDVRYGNTNDKGTVSFIDVKASYTPKELQTSANKNKESMKIKVSLAADTPLKIGETAEVMIEGRE